MRTPRLAIRADATSAIGAGHLVRMTALAQAWAERKRPVFFLSRVESEALARGTAAQGFQLTDVAAQSEDQGTAALLEATVPGDWIALDGYVFHADMQRSLRRAGRKVLVMDDINDRDEYQADILLNQNTGAQDLSYKTNPEAAKLLGTEFVLLRECFRASAQLRREHAPRATNILVMFGGFDSGNVSAKILEALAILDASDIHVRMVADGSPERNAALRAQARRVNGQVDILDFVEDMPKLMDWADIAISSAGSTCWEMCFLGLPALVTALVPNQELIANGLHTAGAAAQFSLDLKPDELAQAVRSLLDDQPRRQALSVAGRRMVDGLGAKRVVEAMESLS